MDFSIILQPFAMLLGFFYQLTQSYGLALALICVVFKIILFPISMKGRKGMLDMSRLGDKQKDLQAKFGKDRQQYQIELQKLYETEGVKPSAGCLWSFAPLPLLMALYYIVSQPFKYLMHLSTEQITALVALFQTGDKKTNMGLAQLGMAQDVYTQFDKVQASLPEVAAQITASGGPIDFNFFGINLSETPNFFMFQSGVPLDWAHIGLFLLPIVSAAFALLSMMVNLRMNKKVLGTTTQQDTTNKQMMFIQPMISLFLGFTLPAALGVYWTANSILAIFQEFFSLGILRKHVKAMNEKAAIRAEENREKEKELKRQAAEQKKKKQEEAQRIKLERKVSAEGLSMADSRVGMRAYARGRTFDKDRYPVTPYRDPDDIIREQKAAWEKAQEEKRQAYESKKGKKGGKNQVEPYLPERDAQMRYLEEDRYEAPAQAPDVLDEGDGYTQADLEVGEGYEEGGSDRD